MTRARGIVLWLDVADGIGKVTPGGVVVLYGDAPVWKYCNWFHRVIAEGAAVVAIGHGIDVGADASNCTVAYSTVSEYAIGKPISQRLGEEVRITDGIPIEGTTKSIVVIPSLPD